MMVLSMGFFVDFKKAKTADAKLFTSALGACSAGSCWAQAVDLVFARKVDP